MKFLKAFVICLLLLFSNLSFTQHISYSDNVEISVLTCGSGEELYSKFGHSAFRIRDIYNHTDIVYNYGVFDFSAPNFYTNFAKGKLLYKLGRTRYDYFFQQYTYENRNVHEQVLNLNNEQKKKLIAFLETNAQPENASYQYDFFYNNCATKIRYVIDKALPGQVRYSNQHITSTYTLRQLINANVHYNTWGNVGINIALGSVIDKPATKDEYQFLPEYIYKAFDNATINKNQLVLKENTLISKNQNNIVTSNFITSPIFVFLGLAMIIIFITYYDLKSTKRTKILDFILFFCTGVTGVLLLLLWFATNHQTTANNYNILWAFPSNLIIAFILISNKISIWLKRYVTSLVFFMVMLAVIWIFKIEEFPLAMLPFFIALFIRYCYLFSYFK